MRASPAPVVVHIVSAIPYAVLGAFQFSRRFRRRWPAWHRGAGRALVVLGLAVGFSALSMTQFYPRQPGTGELAYFFRLAVGSGMAASIILGLAAIRHADVERHRVWTTRACTGSRRRHPGLHPRHRQRRLRRQRTHHGPHAGARIGLNLIAAEFIIRSSGKRTARTTGETPLS